MNLQEIIAEIVDHLRGMWRFRWLAVGVAWLVAVAGWYFVFSMPDIYQASARVSVDTNSLLPVLTKGLTASENLMSEVDIVSEAMLTRPNLERVARNTDLDLRAGSPQELELLITSLQKRVEVRGGRDNIFNISYQDRDRNKAREVVAELMNSFVESSLGAQGDDAAMTERAIASEIADHERRLLQAEERLADFKKRNIGYMPNDGSDYYTRLQTALGKVSETEQQIRQIRQRRDEISRQLEGEEPVFGIMSATPVAGSGGCSHSGSISQLQAQLADLRVDFTDKHPRIVMLQDTIAALEEECRKERAEGGEVIPKPPATSLDANPVYQSLRLQLSNANVELAALQEQHSSRQREVAQLRADVDKIAEVEAELKRLNRDYGVVANRHQELLRRWESIQSKKRLDPVTDQVQFNILEPPFAAATPVAPNRPMLLVGVVIFALGAGGVVAFALNQLNPVFFTRHSVSRVAGLPVLGTVSLLMSPHDFAARRVKAYLWLGANLVLVACGIVLVAFEDPVLGLISGLARGAGL